MTKYNLNGAQHSALVWMRDQGQIAFRLQELRDAGHAIPTIDALVRRGWLQKVESHYIFHDKYAQKVAEK